MVPGSTHKTQCIRETRTREGSYRRVRFCLMVASKDCWPRTGLHHRINIHPPLARSTMRNRKSGSLALGFLLFYCVSLPLSMLAALALFFCHSRSLRATELRPACDVTFRSGPILHPFTSKLQTEHFRLLFPLVLGRRKAQKRSSRSSLTVSGEGTPGLFLTKGGRVGGWEGVACTPR